MRCVSNVFYPGPRCDKPLGMQNGRLRTNQLMASSSWDKNHGPSNARLHWRRTRGRTGAWSARHNTRHQWLQVNFGRPTRVTKISTQGRQDARQWVRQYYVTFSQDGAHFAEYKLNSNRKVFKCFHTSFCFTILISNQSWFPFPCCCPPFLQSWRYLQLPLLTPRLLGHGCWCKTWAKTKNETNRYLPISRPVLRAPNTSAQGTRSLEG